MEPEIQPCALTRKENGTSWFMGQHSATEPHGPGGMHVWVVNTLTSFFLSGRIIIFLISASRRVGMELVVVMQLSCAYMPLDSAKLRCVSKS